MQQHLTQLLIDAGRLCVWFVLLAAIFTPLEWFFAPRPRQKRQGIWRDIGYFFLNNLVPSAALLPVLVLLGWLLHFLVPARFYDFVGSLPVWFRLLAGLVVGDVFYYWGHRLMHRNPFLWRFHAIHHAAPQMDWLVSTRAHPVDIVFGHLCGLVPLYALGLTQPIGKGDILPELFVLVGFCWGFFIHANLPWRMGILGRVVSTPGFHHWHHTLEGPYDRNFASLLPWVDRIFGTYHMPAILPQGYGIKDPMGEGLVAQLLVPFETVKVVYETLPREGGGSS